MSRPRRRSDHGRFEIVGRGFPPCRQGQLASGGDDNVGVPSLSIDSVLRHPPLKGLPESANRTKMVHVKHWGENTQGLFLREAEFEKIRGAHVSHWPAGFDGK